MPRNLSRRASLLIALAAASPWALAQTTKASASAAPVAWPTKPLKIIVGFPAGTSPDLTARTFAEPLSKALG
ncbi:MAG: tripartite tricarboxylate transporter substrate binding protein, partial [Burkholderiaceae bacterium]|nr:tripartite tricarboxylate transporter substrate binding protein [Burkholderiaceae bacterium]